MVVKKGHSPFEAEKIKMDIDEPFPRGGSSALTPLEERKLKVKAKRDFENESAQPTVPKQKKRRSGQAQEKRDEEGSLFKTKALSGELPKLVELLKYKNLQVGAKIWGAVTEVNSKRLSVSLPDGLRAVVYPDEASDVLEALLSPQLSAEGKRLRAAISGPPPTLETLFFPGQFVQCVLTSTGSETSSAKNTSQDEDTKAGRKVVASLRLSKVCSGMDKVAAFVGSVIPACIRTVEEHGCSLSLGPSAVSGYLPLKAYQETFGASVSPVPGQMLQVVVKKSLRSGTHLEVGCNPLEVASGMLQASNNVTFGNLLPGQLVTVVKRARLGHVRALKTEPSLLMTMRSAPKILLSM